MDQRSNKKATLDAVTKELLIGVFLLVVFLLIFYGASHITAKISDGVVSARFFPYLVAGFGTILSLSLVISNAYKKWVLKVGAPKAGQEAQTINEEKKSGPPIRWGMIVLSIVLMAIYLILIDILGFIVASMLYLMAQILILQQNRTVKRVIMVVAISIVVPVIIYLPFRYIFSLMLPLGIFK